MARLINLANVQQFTAINLTLDPGDTGGPVVVPQCAQIVLIWGLADGRTGHNVLYGRYSGGFAGTVAQANGLVSALFGSSQFTALRADMHSTVTAAGVSIRDVNTPDQAIIPSNVGGAAGSSSGSALPSEVAVVITERTALTGRANRGRIFIPGWATTALGAGDTVAAPTVAALTAWAQTIPTAFAAQGYTLVIGHKARLAYIGSTGTSHPARPAGSVPVTSLTVRDNHWDSQRRRGLR